MFVLIKWYDFDIAWNDKSICDSVGVYRQAYSGIPLAVRFVGRSTALELNGARNTKIYTGSGRELHNTLRSVWLFVLP